MTVGPKKESLILRAAKEAAWFTGALALGALCAALGVLAGVTVESGTAPITGGWLTIICCLTGFYFGFRSAYAIRKSLRSDPFGVYEK